LKRLLESLPRLPLGVAKDRLFIGGKYLDRKNVVHRDLALAFHARDIAAVTFHDWLTRDDVLSLCRILATDALEIREAGGLRELMKNELLMGIDLRAIDYSRLRFTDEKEVFAEAAGDDQNSGDLIWRSFVSHLLSGCLDSNGSPVSPDEQQSEDPRTIAKMLNSSQLGLQGAIAGYEKTLGRFLCETTGNEPLEKLMDLLRNLTPELRGQFLSATFEHMAGSGREELFGCFPDDIVLEMLQQANNEAREISPSLMSLLERVSRIETEAHPPGVGEKGGALKDSLEACLSADQAQTLFERESYETFVDSEYQDLLKELVTSSSISEQVGEGPRNRQTPEVGSTKGQTGVEVEAGSVSNEYVAAMEDRHVDLRLGHMLAAMLRQCVEMDE